MKVALYFELPLDPDSIVPFVEQVQTLLQSDYEPLSLAPAAKLIDLDMDYNDTVHLRIEE